ncbi:MAG: ethanolamine ammonia-lyase subunit EutB [Eubacteriales bacterium]|nr:ethanolamine ammonia-lyase subunit EutB [Eubacteriales bacterium]
MELKTSLYNNIYSFSSIKEVLAKANEKKSGDTLAGVGAKSDLERVAAKVVLADLTVKDITENPAIDYDRDSVTRIILDDLDKKIYEQVKGITIGDLREYILDSKRKYDELSTLSKGLSSEVIASVCKLMSNLDLMYVSSKLEVTAHCNTTIGKSGTFSSRLQPNHPTDSVKGVTSSLLEGLSYGVGDAVLGLNPAVDTLESTSDILNLFNDVKTRLEIPTQICVLSHITTQMKALEKGVPMDLCFQSIAGSEVSLASFGVTVNMLKEANDMMKEKSTAQGPNYMYFETGQGSELSSNGHDGADQQTMEARCYGLARHYKPFLVNTVVGFIGPEYIYDTKELIRASLEDIFCGLFHGLPMGCDICYTNHMKADQNDVDSLLVMLASSGCRYVMGVPEGDDIMLMYQSTGFHDIATVREMLNKRPIREFENWLEKFGIMENGKLTELAGDPTIFMQ